MHKNADKKYVNCVTNHSLMGEPVRFSQSEGEKVMLK
jgi:hypothetical protein